MAAVAMIIAHENPFNRYILNDNALYFKTSEDIRRLLNADNEWINKKAEWTLNNKMLIVEKYQWEKVVDQYEELFRSVLEVK